MADLIEDRKLEERDIYTEMKKSYIDYAMSVIVGRALPDARDGLKPVQRRILYGMSQLGIPPNKPHKKSARIVGEVMGKYHPHGDGSIYDAMVRMAQDFSLRYMLVDGHGNFGSIDGDSAAAMRYTEARMTPFAMEMLRDIEKDTVDFKDNFDGEEKEPVVLPARFPQLLVNGSNGIAVGMATSIPPHNLREVINATVLLIDNPDAGLDEIMKEIKGPDFPTGALIMGKSGIREAYKTGRGQIKIRACCRIEELNRGRTQIVVTEIPFMVNKARMIERIAERVKEKKLEGISAIRDESNREGIRIVIELKRDANPNLVLNRLYQQTQLQQNFSMIMIALVDGEPKLLDIKSILVEYLKFQKEVVTRRTEFDLKRAEERAHILEGLRIALDNIDEIIKTIRESYDDAASRLMKKFGLSDIQAKAILDMRLARLQGLEREKLEAEYKELMEKITYYKSLLADDTKLMQVIKEELEEISDKFGDKRRTRIVRDDNDIDEEDLIAEEDVAVTLTYLGYIKRVPADTYKAQRRGGKGITGMTTRNNDFVKDLTVTSTHDYLMFVTNTGKVHKLKAYEIPEASRQARGTPAINFLHLEQRERITAMIPVSEFDEDKYLIGITKKGLIKKTPLSEFDTKRSTGIIAMKLRAGDELIAIKESTGTSDIIIVTKKGKCISFPEEDVRPMGRIAGGVRAVRLDDDDEVVSMELVKDGKHLLVVTENGYGKRTLLDEYKIQNRGGKGLLTYDRAKFEKTGNLIGGLIVGDEDEIFLINSDGVIIRIRADEVSVLGRATQGVKIMKVEDGSRIVAIAKLDDADEDEEDGKAKASKENSESY
jgi:DNA gyrase subunit A